MSCTFSLTRVPKLSLSQYVNLKQGTICISLFKLKFSHYEKSKTIRSATFYWGDNTF